MGAPSPRAGVGEEPLREEAARLHRPGQPIAERLLEVAENILHFTRRRVALFGKDLVDDRARFVELRRPRRLRRRRWCERRRRHRHLRACAFAEREFEAKSAARAADLDAGEIELARGEELAAK